MREIGKKIISLIGVSPAIKRILSVFSYGMVPIVGVGLSVFFPSGELFRKFGELAEWGLIVILFMKPVAFVVPLQFLKRAITYRRQMGVTVFWLATFHGFGYMYLYGIWLPKSFLGWENFLLYGGVAMGMMLVLGITSNDVSVRFFRSNWKRIQYLAYPTFFFVLLHSSMAKGEFVKIVVFGGAYILLKYLEIRGFRLNRYIPILNRLKM